jgi:hypothetical protein
MIHIDPPSPWFEPLAPDDISGRQNAPLRPHRQGHPGGEARTWDQSGMPTASAGEGVITERIHLDPANPDIIRNQITTIDNSLTRPWSTTKSYRRNTRNVVWAQDRRSEGNPHVVIPRRSISEAGTECWCRSRRTSRHRI